MKANSFVLYTDQFAALSALSDVQLGALIRAIFRYVEGDTSTLSDPVVSMAFAFMKNQLDIDRKKYADVCTKRQRAAQARWNKSTSPMQKHANANFAVHNDNINDNINEYENDNVNDTNTDNKNVSENNNENNSSRKRGKRNGKRFTPPTLVEISEFVISNHLSIDAQRFYDYYQCRGWKLSNNVCMKDWKAALRNWERQEYQQPPTVPAQDQRLHFNADEKDYSSTIF